MNNKYIVVVPVTIFIISLCYVLFFCLNITEETNIISFVINIVFVPFVILFIGSTILGFKMRKEKLGLFSMIYGTGYGLATTIPAFILVSRDNMEIMFDNLSSNANVTVSINENSGIGSTLSTLLIYIVVCYLGLLFGKAISYKLIGDD